MHVQKTHREYALLQSVRKHERTHKVHKRTLFEVQIQTHTCHSPGNFFTKALLQLFNVRHETLILGLHQHKVTTLQELDLRLELRKVDLFAQELVNTFVLICLAFPRRTR